MTGPQFLDKLKVLRGCLAGAMKNHSQYVGTDHWKVLLSGGKVGLGCSTIYGDVFAFWFSELRIGTDPLLYDAVWDQFSSVPRPKDSPVKGIGEKDFLEIQK